MFIQISSMIMLVWLNMVSVLQLFHVYVTWTWYSSTWVWSQSLTWLFLQIVHVFNRISDCSLLVSLFECHYPSIYIQRRFGQLCHALEISIFFKMFGWREKNFVSTFDVPWNKLYTYLCPIPHSNIWCYMTLI